MKKWILIGAAVLGVVLLAGAGYYLFHGAPPIPKGSSPDLMGLAPADANAIVFVDFTAVRSSDVGKQLDKLVNTPGPAAKEFQEFVNGTNFHFEKDLDHILIAGSAESSSPGVFIIEGKFDQPKIEQYAAKYGMVSHNQAGDVYIFSPGAGSSAVAMMFVAPNRIAFATGAGGETEVLVMASNMRDKNFVTREDYRERAARVGGAPIFAVGDVPKVSVKALAMASLMGTGGGDAAKFAESIGGWDFAVWMDGETLRFAVEAECNSRIDALRARMALAKMQSEMASAQQKSKSGGSRTPMPDMSALTKSFDVTLDGRYVRMSAALSKNDLMKMGSSMMAAGMR
jgi:hypothetical protein